jgi:hypothetical protein
MATKQKISKEQLKRHEDFVNYLDYIDACSAAVAWVKRNKHDIHTAWANCKEVAWLEWLMNNMIDGTAREKQCFPSYTTIVRRCVMVVDEAFKKSTELKLEGNKELKKYLTDGIKLMRAAISGNLDSMKEMKKLRVDLRGKMRDCDYAFKRRSLEMMYELTYSVGSFLEAKKRNKGKGLPTHAGFDVEEYSGRIEHLFQEEGLASKIFRRIVPLNKKACDYFLSHRKKEDW